MVQLQSQLLGGDEEDEKLRSLPTAVHLDFVTLHPGAWGRQPS